MKIYSLDVLPVWNQSVVPCPILTVASLPAYRFLRRQVKWSGIPISWRIFHSLLWSTQSKALTESINSRWFSGEHPGMRSQVGLRKHHYEQSPWRWWNPSWAISNPKWWRYESVAFNMLANLENSVVATGLEKVSFHSNSKEKQCQRTFQLPYNCTHFTH